LRGGTARRAGACPGTVRKPPISRDYRTHGSLLRPRLLPRSSGASPQKLRPLRGQTDSGPSGRQLRRLILPQFYSDHLSMDSYNDCSTHTYHPRSLPSAAAEAARLITTGPRNAEEAYDLSVADSWFSTDPRTPAGIGPSSLPLRWRLRTHRAADAPSGIFEVTSILARSLK
jgi:hypothetical protein